MKVLIYRYGSVCEPDMIETMQRLGFQVEEENVEVFDKEILPAQAMNIVRQHLERTSFSFVITVNYFPWLSQLCNIYKLTYLSVIVDSPVLELYSESIRNSCNRIFLFDSALYKEFAPYNPDGIFYMPLAANVLHSDEICTKAPKEQAKSCQADIAFVGSLYTEKCLFNDVQLPDRLRGYAQGLIEAQLKVYGYNFLEDALTDEFVEVFCKSAPNLFRFPEGYRENYRALVAQQYLSVKVAEQERIRFLAHLSEKYEIHLYTDSDTSGLPKVHNCGFADYRKKMPLIFRNCKINLNMTAKSIRNGLPQRVFDVLGCAGFLITNYQADLDDIFEAGVDLETYDSLEELDDKIGYYLNHEEERRRIALQGYEKVKNYHSYDKRIVELLHISFPESN